MPGPGRLDAVRRRAEIPALISVWVIDDLVIHTPPGRFRSILSVNLQAQKVPEWLAGAAAQEADWLPHTHTELITPDKSKEDTRVTPVSTRVLYYLT